MRASIQKSRARAFSSPVCKKKLFKRGKLWAVGSVTLLAMAGLGVTTQHPASAAATPSAAATSSASGTEKQATAVYNHLVAHQIATSSTGSQASSSAPSASGSSSAQPAARTLGAAKPRTLGDPAPSKVWADIQYVNMDGQNVASDAEPNEPIDPNTVSDYAKNIPGCTPFLGGSAMSTTTSPTTSKDSRDVWQFAFNGSPTGKATWQHPDKLPAGLKPATPTPKPTPKPQPKPDNSEYADQTITVHYVNDTPGEPTYGQEFMSPTVAHYNAPIDTSDNTAVWHPASQIMEFIGFDANGQRHAFSEDQIDRSGDHYDPTLSEQQYPVGYHLTKSDKMAWESGSNIVSDISASDASDQNGTNGKSVHPFFFAPHNENVYLHFTRARAYINMSFTANDADGPQLKAPLRLSDVTNQPVNLALDIPSDIDGFKYSPDYTGRSVGYDPFTLKRFDNAIVDPQSKVSDDIYSVYVPASDSVTYTYHGTPVGSGYQATRSSNPQVSDYDHGFQNYVNQFSQQRYPGLPSQYSVGSNEAAQFYQQFVADAQAHRYGFGHYHYTIPVHVQQTDTVNYTYNGHVITQDGQTYSKQFTGPSDTSDVGLKTYYAVKSANDWTDAPAGYSVTDASKDAFFHQMADYFNGNGNGHFQHAVINIPLEKPSANLHVYYETPNGQQLQPTAQLANIPGTAFDVHRYLGTDYAPAKLTVSGVDYQRVGLLHPATAFDPESGQTHTIDAVYEPVAKLQPITVHYLNSDHQTLAPDAVIPSGPVNRSVTDKQFTNYRQTGQLGDFTFAAYPKDVYFTYKSTIKPAPEVITKPGPTKYITKNVPGPTKYVNVPGPTKIVDHDVPGPTKYVTKTVNVPGPTKYIHVPGPTKVVTKNVPGPTKYVPVPGPTKTVTKRVNVPGPVKYVTKTVNVPGPTKYVTKYVTKQMTVPGPTKYVTRTVNVPGPARTITKTVNVPGPTKYVRVPGPTHVVTKTVTVPGPTKVVHEPGKTVTKIVRVQTPPEVIHEPGQTITKIVRIPGPVRVQRVPGPTVTKVVYAPSPTKVVYRTVTQQVPGPTITKYVRIPCTCHVVNHLKIVQVPKLVYVYVTPKHRHVAGHPAHVSRQPKQPTVPVAKRHAKPQTKQRPVLITKRHPKPSAIPVRRSRQHHAHNWTYWTGRHHLSARRLQPNVRRHISQQSRPKQQTLPQTSDADHVAVQTYLGLLLIISALVSAGVRRKRD